MAGSSVAPLLRVVTNPQSTQVKRSTVAIVLRRLYSLHPPVGGGGEGMTRGGFRGRRAPGGAFGGVSTGMSLASRCAWATRAVASKDISSPVKARSKPDVSPPIVGYARASDCNVLSFLAFLGQVSSPAQCPRAPHASQLVRLLSSARRFLRSSNDRLLPLYLPLPLPLIFPLPLLLPLPLHRCIVATRP